MIGTTTKYDPELFNGFPFSTADTDLYPAIEPSKSLKTELPFNLIPGVGYKSSKECGIIKKAAACLADPKHFSRPYPLKCGKMTCPVCYQIEITRNAKRASDRIHGFIDALRGVDSPEYKDIQKQSERWMHVVLSAPPGLFEQTDDVTKMYRIGIDMAKRLGLKGGYIVYHPYRIDPQYRDMFIDMNQALVDHQSDTEKFWEQFIRRDVLNLGHWTKYLIWSPHWHFVAFGFLKNTTDFHQENHYGSSGWVYKNLNPNGIDLERAYNEKDVGYHDHIRTILSYQLNHAAYVPGKKSLRAFGVVHPSFVKRLEDVAILDMRRAVCPVCQAPVVRYEVDEYGDFVDPDNPVQCVCKLKQHKYEIRTRKKANPGKVVNFKINNSDLKEKLRL